MIKLKSYAKINLGLEVLGKRTDNFHEIFSIMTKISLFDELIIQKSDKNKVIQKGIPEENNLVYKVLTFMHNKLNISDCINIRVNKNIPYSSGMGGGSSNAATTIEGINSLLNLNLDSKEKFDIALKFGSDIPFFLGKNTALISGRGDNISFMKDPKIDSLLLFHPFYDVSEKTKQVFNNVKSFTDGKNQEKIRSLINNDELLHQPFFNGLEESAFTIFKDLKQLKYNLINLGLNNLSMTGSGPTYFSVMESYEKAKKIKGIIDQNFKIKTYITNTL